MIYFLVGLSALLLSMFNGANAYAQQVSQSESTRVVDHTRPMIYIRGQAAIAMFSFLDLPHRRGRSFFWDEIHGRKSGADFNCGYKIVRSKKWHAFQCEFTVDRSGIRSPENSIYPIGYSGLDFGPHAGLKDMFLDGTHYHPRAARRGDLMGYHLEPENLKLVFIGATANSIVQVVAPETDREFDLHGIHCSPTNSKMWICTLRLDSSGRVKR